MKESEFPISYNLIKLKTLEDAYSDQEWKYPSGSTMFGGFLFEHTLPEIGERFFVHSSKLNTGFSTSPVNKIIEETDDHIIFETWNSIYKIEFK